MILTCPQCGTQYLVKDGAIPAAGRQVRCASCGNRWHQGPEEGDVGASLEAGEPAPSFDRPDDAPADAPVEAPYEPVEAEDESEVPTLSDDEQWDARDRSEDLEQTEAAVSEEEGARDAWVEPVEDEVPDDRSADAQDELTAVAAAAAASPMWEGVVAPPGDPMIEPDGGAAAVPEEPIAEDDLGEEAEDRPRRRDERRWVTDEDDAFAPFAVREPEPGRGRGGIIAILLVVLLIAAAGVAFWKFAPAEWKQRIGLAEVTDETPLQLMMTHSDRQRLASGNELLAVSGRVINPTDAPQDVPPIRAELHSTTGKLVYSWTIPPPARTLAPGASATFNSAELNVPAGGEELTVTLGDPNA